MKYLALIAFSAFYISGNARILGGSGGTSGGNPKAISAPLFNADPARAGKLARAIEILKGRLSQNCFPADYNKAVLAELNWLINTNQIYYFPETAILGADRYLGDYSVRQENNGEFTFYHVGAFTEKRRGEPIFFTRDSDAYNAEELAMTFAQDLNDHVLQWDSESDLNSVGAMAMGQLPCDQNSRGAYRVFSEFPESDPGYASKKLGLMAYVESGLEERADGPVMTFGRFQIRSITLTDLGFSFVPVAYQTFRAVDLGPGHIGTVEEWLPFSKELTLEVVSNPFRYVRETNLVASESGLYALIRERETKTVLTEFIYDPSASFGAINMDPICDYREFDGADSIRKSMGELQSPFSGASYYAQPVCNIEVRGGSIDLTIHKQPGSLCLEGKAYDVFARTKTVDDFAAPIYCQTNKFSTESYKEILGDKNPSEFVANLIKLNERKYRERNSVSGHLPWLHKNILGGTLDELSGALTIARDKNGEPYSVFVPQRGQYIMNGRDEESDDDEVSYQCFFKGSLAGKCIYRSFDD